jgi:ABC-2 type transport system permease protein
MLHNVLLKTLRDQDRALIGWAASIVLLVAMYVAIWPSMRGQPSMSDFINQMPEAFRKLFAMAGADLSTPIGYIKIELLSFMGPILVILYAVIAGASAIAGEEDRRTLDLLLGAPVSRARIVLEKAAAMVIVTVGLSALLGFALVVEGSFADMHLPPDKIAAAMLHLALLGLVFGAIALALGAGTGRPGLAKGLPAVLAVVLYIVNGLGGMTSWLEPFQKLSPFFQYAGHDPLVNGVSWPAAIVSAGTVVVLVVVAVVGLVRRDVRG